MAKSKRNKAQLKKEVFAYHLKYPDTAYSRFNEVNSNWPKHHNTIKSWVEEMYSKSENGQSLEQTYQNKIQKENKNVFEYLENDTALTIETIGIIKQAIKQKAMKAEDDAFTNIKDIAVTYGIIVEKELAIKQHSIKLKELALKERSMDLKERELEAKMANPQAFVVDGFVDVLDRFTARIGKNYDS